MCAHGVTPSARFRAPFLASPERLVHAEQRGTRECRGRKGRGGRREAKKRREELAESENQRGCAVRKTRIARGVRSRLTEALLFEAETPFDLLILGLPPMLDASECSLGLGSERGNDRAVGSRTRLFAQRCPSDRIVIPQEHPRTRSNGSFRRSAASDVIIFARQTYPITTNR